MNNAAFGKLKENVRYYKTVKLVTTWEDRSGEKTFHNQIFIVSMLIYGNNEIKEVNVKFNKPIYQQKIR